MKTRQIRLVSLLLIALVACSGLGAVGARAFADDTLSNQVTAQDIVYALYTPRAYAFLIGETVNQHAYDPIELEVNLGAELTLHLLDLDGDKAEAVAAVAFAPDGGEPIGLIQSEDGAGYECRLPVADEARELTLTLRVRENGDILMALILRHSEGAPSAVALCAELPAGEDGDADSDTNGTEDTDDKTDADTSAASIDEQSGAEAGEIAPIVVSSFDGEALDGALAVTLKRAALEETHTLKGTAQAGETLYFHINDESNAANTDVADDGSWTFELTAQMIADNRGDGDSFDIVIQYHGELASAGELEPLRVAVAIDSAVDLSGVGLEVAAAGREDEAAALDADAATALWPREEGYVFLVSPRETDAELDVRVGEAVYPLVDGKTEPITGLSGAATVALALRGQDEALAEYAVDVTGWADITIDALAALNAETIMEPLTISGTAQPDKRVRLLVNGNSSMVYAKADGTWSTQVSLNRDDQENAESVSVAAMYYGRDLNKSGIHFAETHQRAEQAIEIDTAAPTVEWRVQSDWAAKAGEIVKYDAARAGEAIELVLTASEEIASIQIDGAPIEIAAVEGEENACAVTVTPDKPVQIELRDAAGNAALAAVDFKPIDAIAIVGLDDGYNIATAADGLRFTVSATEDEALNVCWSVNNGPRIQVTAGEDGAYAIDRARLGNGEASLTITAAYDSLPFMPKGERASALHLKKPALNGITVACAALAQGEARLDEESGLTRDLVALSADGSAVIRVSGASDAGVTLYVNDREASAFSDQLGNYLDKAEKALVIEARDAFGNRSDALTVRFKSAGRIAFDPMAAAVVGPNHPLTVTGSAEANQLIAVELKSQSGATVRSFEPVRADESGAWQFVLSADTLPEGWNRNGALAFAYQSDDGAAQASDFDFQWDDRVDSFVVDDITDMDSAITGEVEKGAAVSLKGDGATGVVDDEGRFAISLLTPAREGAIYTVVAVDAYGNEAEIAVPALANGDIAAITVTDGPVYTGQGGFTLTGTAAEAVGFVELYDVDNGQALCAAPVGPGGAFALEYAYRPTDVEGERACVVRYADGHAADSATAPFLVTIDATAPTFEAPESVSDNDRLILTSISEGATVTVYDADGETEIVRCDVAPDSLALDSLDLWDRAGVVLAVEDSFGNAAEAMKAVAVTPSPRCAVVFDGFEGRVFDYMDPETFTIYVVTAAGYTWHSIELEPLVGGERMVEPITGEAAREVLEMVGERMRTDGATVFHASFIDVRLRDGLGAQQSALNLTPKVVLSPASDAPQLILVSNGDEVGEAEAWTIERGVTRAGTLRRGILFALCALVLAAAVVGVLLLSKKLNAVRDAMIDENTRQSQLTIKKQK